MHLRLVAVDKLRDPHLAAIAAELTKRLGAYHRLETIEVRASDPAAEGEAILRAHTSGPLWLLDVDGTLFSSETLAARFDALPVNGVSHLTLAIAGTFGPSPALRARADLRWSLSPLTFLHEWARVLVLEQLYRAAKIARNEPYHH